MPRRTSRSLITPSLESSIRAHMCPATTEGMTQGQQHGHPRPPHPGQGPLQAAVQPQGGHHPESELGGGSRDHPDEGVESGCAEHRVAGELDVVPQADEGDPEVGPRQPHLLEAEQNPRAYRVYEDGEQQQEAGQDQQLGPTTSSPTGEPTGSRFSSLSREPSRSGCPADIRRPGWPRPCHWCRVPRITWENSGAEAPRLAKCLSEWSRGCTTSEGNAAGAGNCKGFPGRGT